MLVRPPLCNRAVRKVVAIAEALDTDNSGSLGKDEIKAMFSTMSRRPLAEIPDDHPGPRCAMLCFLPVAPIAGRWNEEKTTSLHPCTS